MIYLIGIYFYIIWITIYCDSWSKKLFELYDLDKKAENGDIIPKGKNIKYYILIMGIINTIINFIFEWVIMRAINNWYENKEIKKYKKEIEYEKIMKNNNINNKKNKEVKINKYHRVYYYDRRKKT